MHDMKSEYCIDYVSNVRKLYHFEVSALHPMQKFVISSAGKGPKWPIYLLTNLVSIEVKVDPVGERDGNRQSGGEN